MVTQPRHGRKRPYSTKVIGQQPCTRCGSASVHQWRVCADALWRPICAACDLELNRLVMTWIGMSPDEVDRKMANYEGHSELDGEVDIC